MRSFGTGLSELPAIAAKPPTNPPIKAVTSINKTEEPPNLKSSAILKESRLPFLLSIHAANIAHKIKIPRKPDKNATPIFCGINKATKNETSAMLHHSKRRPARKLSVAVSNKAKTSLLVFKSGFSKS